MSRRPHQPAKQSRTWLKPPVASQHGLRGALRGQWQHQKSRGGCLPAPCCRSCPGHPSVCLSGLSSLLLGSERALTSCTCTAPSSAPLWLAHSLLLVELQQESQQEKAEAPRVHQALTWGWGAHKLPLPACRPLQRQATPALGAQGPVGDTQGTHGGHVLHKHSGCCALRREGGALWGGTPGTSANCWG